MFPRHDPGSDDMTDVSYTVSPYSTAGAGRSCGGKHKHAHEASSTTGASGSAFELLLNGQANSDGTTTDALTNSGDTDGSDLGSAYQSLFAKLQANGETGDTSAAQLSDALSQIDTTSAHQTQFVDSPVNDLNSKLNLDAQA
jgi:hypothetical protein